MIKRIKYFIVNLLDRSPNVCWADLVLWAEGRQSFLMALREFRNLTCEREGIAYCGKCYMTGKTEV